MPQPPQGRPAAVSDFDDDAGMERGPVLEARTGRSAIVRHHSSRMPSRSGDSRTRSSTVAGQGDIAIRSRAPAGNAPVVQIERSSSRSGNYSMAPPSLPRRTSSMSQRPSSGCTIPDCSDPNCQSARNTERRYVISRPNPQPIQGGVPMHSQTLYPQPTMPSARSEIPGVTPRVRANSFTSRPQSWAGGPYVNPFPAPFAAPTPTPSARGPPPSPSAYLNFNPAQPFQTWQATPQYTPPVTYGAPPAYMPAPTSTYPPPPTISYQQPTPYMQSGAFAPETTYPPRLSTSHTTYSIPQPSPTLANEMYNARLPARTSSTGLARSGSLSARASMHVPSSMPGSFPDEDVIDDDEDVYEYRLSPTKSKRDSAGLMPPPRRPALITARPSPRTSIDYSTRPPSHHTRSSSYVDIDRTPRQSDVRRQSSTASSRSRHHSVSDAGSSNRTPATDISNESRGAYVIIEDRHGRRRQYLSAEDNARLKLFQAQQRAKSQKTADAEAYQNAVRGGEAAELTAENIRQMFDQPPSAPRSRMSAQSRRSGQSGTPSDGIKVSYGETTINLTGDVRFEIANSADGPRLVINPGSRSEKAYYTETSKSSESRVGRERGESVRDRRPHSSVGVAGE